MLDSDDSLITTLVKTQIDSSRDTMAFFRKVHQINRMALEEIHLPHVVVVIGKWAAAGIGIWILWNLIRPTLGGHLGLGHSSGIRQFPSATPGPSQHHGIVRGTKFPRTATVPGPSRKQKSGLKVSKRQKPKSDPGPSLPRW